MSHRTQQLLFAFVLAFIASTIFWQIRAAYPHDWYTNEPPQGMGSCCGGEDCFEVPMEWVSEDDVNFIVTIPENAALPLPLTKFQGYDPVTHERVTLRVFTFSKRTAKPTTHPSDLSDGKEHSGYHACIWAGFGRCFWFPSNT